MAQWYNILVPSKKINYSMVIAMVYTCIEVLCFISYIVILGEK